MPELPEVETARRGIEPHLRGQRVVRVDLRQTRLRFPVTRGLAKSLTGARISRVERRAKYLLVRTNRGTLLIHLGMSGSLRILSGAEAAGRHDHCDIWLESGRGLRFTDPRRFGSLLWTTKDPLQHRLIKHLGPEPLEKGFSGAYLYALSRRRKTPIKPLIMDARVVVGIGNIYASEALFAAGIRPTRQSGRISLERMELLVSKIREVLRRAIKAGGTTIRDFTGSEGTPGYFAQELLVYDRAGQPCPKCSAPVRRKVLGQRASYYCVACQQ
ncbi:MAG: bifunctional DNA-formamidopyrimidine glycosylase/DNA-(apurinic or apyrimidinic site) lyase [Gammaproteobacteria bacterium]|nr:bifunctional DNA-formamidopyrimidine glycosylase/DNA-(apurinic or apyrimidinic site) lyase [Gammaproteobacteria bacterium]